jgi:hypothetical protein
MDDSRRDELDVLVEGALREWASDESAPDRVWEGIELALRDRSARRTTRSRGFLQFCSDAYFWGIEVLACARIILAPSTLEVENGWAERLVLAGQSHAFYRVSINH